MKFLCDMMLGKLAKYLRILGLDAPYVQGLDEGGEIAASGEPFFFLTRRREIRHMADVIFIESDRVREQVRQILPRIKPFFDMRLVMTRCIACNVSLIHVPKKDVEPSVPEFVFHKYETFMQCPQCLKVYWEGSHAARMSELIEEVMGIERME
ncbi:MAG TPA: Mut7-C RNAse domain-containing protein [Syntrophorhabdaceae bacterium]|jgi:hypothetical protein